MNFLRPHSPYFLIRISRQEQATKQQKIGSIIIPETVRFMMYNVQAGEIVGIGDKAKTHFPEAKVGNILLVHHFVQGESEQEAREDHLVHQDELYNYYVVTCFDFYRKGNETYGVWDGEKIIPNKDYIFLNVPVKNDPNTPDEYIQSALHKNESGIFTFSNWSESRESKADKMKQLQRDIKELSKSGVQKEHIAKAIKEKEAELELLSIDLNVKTYVKHIVAAFHPDLLESIPNICIGDAIYILNYAAETQIDFMDKKYIVAKTNYIGYVNTK